ncbi:cell division protein FtsW [Corynebacterium sp. zg254]|uniref:FtsW/RodA/SpoVE family cell cycle protein n=1 Tax=Corynebacterium zhongnanshanii TaxID=2768834 RepID=A0ABQ6VBM8_9CORY|nr:MULTISPECIES: FtsW/RodA/SpoVE family cell cycle protein [Corynebacterium]KAB3519151.1 FtsW/RodA/SpoVE family cell cycle protein [Corynebacterium zhongnanshanii]MCR5914993.1 cell division protein FtsW [Corynebacterium sp. zg254]
MLIFRRKTEALLLLATAVLMLVANIALDLSRANGAGIPQGPDGDTTNATISSSALTVTGGFFAIFLIAHLVLCWRAPKADQIMLPIVALLNGLGLVMITRLDMATDWNLAKSQIMWTFVGVGLMCAVVIFLKDHRSLQNYTYIMGLAGLILSALPIVWPTSLNADANVWISIGPFSIQPGEFSKLLLLLFFGGLLIQKRRLFTVAGKTFMGLQFPRLRDLGPLFLVWGIALVIMAAQNDFGPALILFGTVLGMLYMATGRASWLILGFGLAAIGAVGVYQISAKIQDRVNNFVDPLAHYDGNGFQLSQALFGMSFGGVTGTGLGQGYPENVPVAHSDFILAAFGEELGLIGLAAILLLYLVLINRGFHTAMIARDSYGKLIAAGMALTITVQIFVVTGGISRLMPMTGLTTPFLSHGGSSLLANYILLALLLRISADARSAAEIRSAAEVRTPSTPGADAR